MSEVTKNPTHYRLLSALKAIGPYLREGQCTEEFYLFDCLAFCVNDKKSPEKREFWGWWMELSPVSGGVQAKYHIGLYNLAGEWDNDNPPPAALPEVNRTQEEFHQKLEKTLKERFALALSIHEQSSEFV